MVGAVSLLAHLTSISNYSLAPDSQTLYHTAEEGYEGLSPKSSLQASTSQDRRKTQLIPS